MPRPLHHTQAQQFSFWKWVVGWHAMCSARTLFAASKTTTQYPFLPHNGACGRQKTGSRRSNLSTGGSFSFCSARDTAVRAQR